LGNTDILIVATGARHPIVNRSHFPNGKETLVIDLSIPNNVDKNVTENENVTLIDVDELSKQIQETIQQREKKSRKPKKSSKK
jgi:glutamyl-tRNA reductase